MALRTRRREPEIMDDPAIDGDEHRRALDGLARINTVSRSARILWSAVLTIARENSDRPVRILDIGTGAGDVPIALLRLARRGDVPLEVEACDVSDRALECARDRARAGGVRLRLFQRDVVREPIAGEYDVVISSLFLHHLPSVQAIALLSNMRECSSRLVLVNDLRRGAAGLAAAWIVPRLLTRSRIVHVDGVRSVRAAFTISEIKTLAEQAGMGGASVTKRWPWRFLLEWRRR